MESIRDRYRNQAGLHQCYNALGYSLADRKTIAEARY